MKTKKTILAILLLLVAAVQIHAALIQKEIVVTEYVDVASPQHVEGNTYQAADGTQVTLEEGQDPKDPNSYKDENGSHGVPKSTEKRTYTIKYYISDVLDTPENEAIVVDELRNRLADTYDQSEGTRTTIAGITKVSVTEKIMGSTTYERTSTIFYGGKIEQTVVSSATDNIDLSNSVQVGDPVLMTSGQYRYDETDVSITAGNAVLELSRHYQSGENHGDSIGRKWFFSLDTRILRGTSLSSEDTYKDATNTIQLLTNELTNLKTNLTNLESEYNNSITLLNTDIQTSGTAIDTLRNSGYSNYKEIKGCIENLTIKLGVQQDYLDDLINDKTTIISNTNGYIKEYERQLGVFQTSAASLRLIVDLSAYNKKCNERAERGYGFNENKDIDAQIIIVYDTYGRKSLYEVKTEAQPTPNGIGNPYPNGAETVCISGGTDTLRINPNESFTLTKRDGTEWLYGADGMLRSITDRYRNNITIGYEDGEAASISANGVKLWAIERPDGKISAIVNARDFKDKTIYFYDGDRLSGVKDNDGDTISFGYMDCTGDYLDSIQKPDRSIVHIDYGYVRDGMKLVSQTSNEEEACETFSYNQSGKKVEHTSHSGVKTLYEYDDKQRLTKQTDADGTIKEYGYDDEGNIVWEICNGNRTDYEVNQYGEKTLATYKDGSSETWTYDEYGRVTSYKDRDNIVSEYIRYSSDRLMVVKCGGTTLFTYEYDIKGRIKSITTHRADGTCSNQTFIYNNLGNITDIITSNAQNIAVSSTESITESWTYDTRDRPLSYSINGQIEETYAYDGRKTTVTTRSGLVTEYVTDCRKDCVSVKETDTLTGEVRFISVEYDKRHLPIKRTLSSGEGITPVMSAEYRYLPGGEPEAELISDGNNNIVTIYGYKDTNGVQTDSITKIQRIQCTAEELFAARNEQASGAYGTPGTGSSSNTSNSHGTAYGDFTNIDLNKLWNLSLDKYEVSYAYEHTADGTRVTVTAPDGTQTITEYDVWSRPKAMTDASGITSILEYSPAGRLKKQQSSYGGFNVYAYDTAGTLTGAGHEGGDMSSSVINPDGSPFKVTDRNGRTTEYAYDSMNRLIKVTQAAGSSYYTYDAKGRLTLAVTGGDGSITAAEEYTSYVYDDDERTTTVSRGGLYPLSYTMNAWGETISVTDGEGNSRTSSYDCAGRVSSSTDGYGNITTYEYDVRGLVTKAVYPDGTDYEYRYDVFGNVTERLFCGKTTWKGCYDSAGRLTEQQGKLSTPMAYKYDSAGRLSEVSTAGMLTSSYDYEDNGRTVKVTSGNNHVYTYKYDSFGLLDFETNRNGLTQDYVYDGEDHLSVSHQFSGKSTSYIDSPDGLTQTIAYSDGTSGSVSYTLSGRVKSIRNASGEILYEYDKGGMLVKQTDKATGQTVSYSYDKAGRRIRTIGEGQNQTMSYGNNGELLTIHDNVTNTGFKLEYDSMMREIKRTAENGVRTETMYNQDSSVDCIITREPRCAVTVAEAYVYGDDGRKEASIDIDGDVTLYEYDRQGRLSAVLHPDTEATAEYERKIIDDLNITEFRFMASESRYLSKKVYEKVAGLQIMCHNITSMIPSYRNFRVERFKYDADGNMTERQIGGALIEYTYDADDRLIACSNGGKNLRTYAYDDDGNLLTISDPSAPNTSIEFAYDGSGRMVSSLINSEGAVLEQTYGYDALGRRVSVSLRTGDNGRSTVWTAYAGTSMNVLRETNDRAVLADGASTIPLGERYRYIDDSTAGNGRTFGNTASGDDSMNYTAGFSTRTTLYIGSSPAAVSADGESRYLSGDDIGSVRCVTDEYGRTTATLSYDVFGTPVADTGYDSGADVMLYAVISRAAYTGKPYDKMTGLYDYGFRDYSPTLARFTTVDPIRDGSNWYTYCAGDPVNFVDVWGLLTSEKKTTVVIIRNTDGNGNAFDADRYIYKDDGKTKKIVYHDKVGANCFEGYENENCFTEPDGEYYYTFSGCKANSDGTYDTPSGKFHNVIRHQTDDPNIPENIRDKINNNPGDFYDHANVVNGIIYGNNERALSAGCTIGKNGQEQQDAYMKALMDGVSDPTTIRKVIHSYSNGDR